MANTAKPPKNVLTTSKDKTIKDILIDDDDLDPQDEEVICKAICYCRNSPNKGAAGNNLYQSCVSKRFTELDKMLFYKSPYKAEITYDMTIKPPKPIMEKEGSTKPHPFVPGWIKKYWEVEKGKKYVTGSKDTRRPDLVIVKDPTKPPTQDNIKNIVEIKFDDTFSADQERAYGKIAGDGNKVKQLDPKTCDCKGVETKEEEAQSAKDFATMIIELLLLRKLPLPKVPGGIPGKLPAPAHFKPIW